MKTDWSQMDGKWTYCDEAFPPCKGKYMVLTTRLNEYGMDYDPDKLPAFDLKDLSDHVVAWWEPTYGPTTPLF